eukprot:1279205-Rhodomonas_salina.1
MSGRNEGNEQRRNLDAAAMMDGTEFDMNEFMDRQQEEARKEGMAGTARLQTARALMDAKRQLREGKTMME